MTISHDDRHDVPLDRGVELLLERGPEGVVRRDAFQLALKELIELEGYDHAPHREAVHRRLLALAGKLSSDADEAMQKALRELLAILDPDECDRLLSDAFGPDVWELEATRSPAEQAARDKADAEQLREDEREAAKFERRQQREIDKLDLIEEPHTTQFSEGPLALADRAIRSAKLRPDQRQWVWVQYRQLLASPDVAQFSEADRGPRILKSVRAMIGQFQSKPIQFGEEPCRKQWLREFFGYTQLRCACPACDAAN